ncbi:MAG: extracellular solute-binding protein [Treponema sp.]|jgi:ABC-type glycerol-3-phosphate transport system substrate-binding protein|nr:extracellular solute-binding protein [Treponema sp.]
MLKTFWKLHKPTIITVAAIVAAVIVYIALNRGAIQDNSEKYYGADLSGESLGRTNIYARYQERYAHVKPAMRDIPIDLFSWTAAEGVEISADFQDVEQALICEERSFIEYTVHIEETGLYNLYLEYFPIPSRGINIERSLFINGKTPFLGADQLAFQRVWGDAAVGFRVDNQGNEIRPVQIEKPRWEKAWLSDSLGYSTRPYEFYFEAGDNTIRIQGVNEPCALRTLSLKAPVPVKNYRQYAAGYNAADYRNTDTLFLQKIQGESALYRSESSLNAQYDRSSGATEPPSVAKVKYNMMGGYNWGTTGQWIEWEFDVPENGMYRITIKGRQNYNRGFVSNRSIMIDGEIPCAELEAVPFEFSNSWKLTTLQSREGEDMYFPLSKGRHSLRMQVTLGDMGEMLTVMEESVFRLNGVYRKILVLTGATPDIYRDYRVDFVYPEVIRAMELESKILYKLVDNITAYAGERGTEAAVALTLARQLELFVRRPDAIPRTLNNFKQNISALGDSLKALSRATLDVDYIVISAPDAPVPPVKDTFLMAASHEVRSFFASFFVDYNNIGDVHRKGSDLIDVWMLSGRDQSIILKAMIDDTFTPQTGIKVNVKLVAADAVMPAVVAGTGPDAALTMGGGDPVNYAIRNAAADMSKFDGFDEAAAQFVPSALVPFRFAGGIYGLPETQYNHVMFYRKDIMEELAIDVPQTWDDLISILPIIQKNNMNVGIPSVASAADFSCLLTLLYQRGGTLYNADNSRTMLDSETVIGAFDFYTKFFSHYKVPLVWDFMNRFRTGEIPLAFSDYSSFSALEAFAPEIRGLWGFAITPGTRMPDGSIDRSVSTGCMSSMIFSGSKHPDLAWEFVRWWVSTETQLRFGRELESIMGTVARYPTANYEAFKRLPWSSEQMAVLDEVRTRWVKGTPEVPGGYFVSRHLSNAIRRILNEGTDVRETVLDYAITINDELIKKRKEFGLE